MYCSALPLFIRSCNRRLLVNAVDKLGVWERTLRRLQPKLGEGDQREIRELLRTVAASGFDDPF